MTTTLARAATTLMLTAWCISKMHHFQLHWHAHSSKWHAAHLLLDSEVCTRPNLRMELRDFDNCDAAETFVRISPFSRAVYSLAEEMHICGNNRCAILYMDITDRLPYVFTLMFVLCVLVIIKFTRDQRHRQLLKRYQQLSLPHHKIV